jgi:hypothetical protein
MRRFGSGRGVLYENAERRMCTAVMTAMMMRLRDACIMRCCARGNGP